MTKEYKVNSSSPNDINVYINFDVTYDAEYRETKERVPKFVRFSVPCSFIQTRELAPKINTIEDIKKVIWAHTRRWFEEQLVKKFPENNYLKYPNQPESKDLLDYDPAQIEYPKEWTPIGGITRQNHIFISCGQGVEAELGKRVAKMVEELTDYEGYFAENQSSNEAIVNSIYKKLAHPAGVIVIMHHRGEVHTPDGEPFQRGSIWCEQEIAITAFQSSLGKDIPLRIYAKKGIILEGLRHFLPKTKYFDSDEEVIGDLEEWLRVLPKSKPNHP